MKQILLTATVLLSGFLITGCAYMVHSDISSVSDPSHGQYQRVLIYAAYENIELRKNYENAFCAALSQNGVASYRSIDLFPPLREYDSTDYRSARIKYGYDAILQILPNGTSTVTRTDVDAGYYYSSASTYQDLDGIYSEIVFHEPGSSKTPLYKASVSVGLNKNASVSNAIAAIAKSTTDDLIKNRFLEKNGALITSSNTSDPNSGWIVLEVIGVILLVALIVVAASNGGGGGGD